MESGGSVLGVGASFLGEHRRHSWSLLIGGPFGW